MPKRAPDGMRYVFRAFTVCRCVVCIVVALALAGAFDAGGGREVIIIRAECDRTGLGCVLTTRVRFTSQEGIKF